MPDLCFCEYYDIEGERNHLLACCCNCSELDESCERLITCKSISTSLQHSVLLTLQDRMRIPWYGGAKQISMGMPFVYVPLLILLATLNVTSTVISGTIGLLIVWIASKSAMMLPKFFATWMAISVVIIIAVFEIYSVPWLLIRPEENILVIALVVTTIICIAKIQCEVKRLQEGISSDKTAYYCQFCQIYKNSGTIHKYWVDTCVTPPTFKFYLIATIYCSVCLLYVANLNLTTVCHPYRPFPQYSLLLPDDCGEVYESFAIALPFVTAIYATVIGCLLLFEFVVNILGYTQCLGIAKVLRLLCSCFCVRSCFRRPGNGIKTTPKNII